MTDKKSRILNKQCNYLFNRLLEKPEYKSLVSKIYELYENITDKHPDIIINLDRILSLTSLKEFIENEAFYELGFRIGRAFLRKKSKCRP